MMERIRLNDDLEPSPIVYSMWRLVADSDTGAAHVQLYSLADGFEVL